ncbi:hypothetical protein, variant [Puccinia triticina 1-1 BBBD Race 1]|uniref:Secreted protein n=1 Tax=Puccinia triticina (isolate 1-1 / race 1 (BBBD)) TaxID=630390 RepID=A0A180GEA0_PUCT1|nr:hypothetical protein, variant [Puccinia triticina 1-1 BBBD Race 1]WAR62582.1 hypothetical protein PtB15_15B168 [Puccinia triticina]
MVSSRFISHVCLLSVLVLIAIVNGAAIPSNEIRSDGPVGWADCSEDISDDDQESDYDEPQEDASVVAISVTRIVHVDALPASFQPNNPEQEPAQGSTTTIVQVSVIGLAGSEEQDDSEPLDFESDADAEVDDETRPFSRSVEVEVGAGIDCEHDYQPREFNTASDIFQTQEASPDSMYRVVN